MFSTTARKKAKEFSWQIKEIYFVPGKMKKSHEREIDQQKNLK